MGNIEKYPPDIIALWEAEGIKKILEETEGKQKSYTAEQYQVARELFEGEEKRKKEESMRRRLETSIQSVEDVGNTFENPDIDTDIITRKLSLAEDNINYVLRHYLLEKRDELTRIFSQVYSFAMKRNSIFSKKNKNKKEFRLTEAEREIRLAPIRPLTKELIQKVKSLHIEQKF